MNIRQNFLETFAWVSARRAPDAPPRPSLTQKAFWVEGWERFKRDGFMSAIGALVGLGGLAMGIISLAIRPVRFDLEAGIVSWQGMGLGLAVLTMVAWNCIMAVRQGRWRRDSGEYLPGSAVAGAIILLGPATSFTGAGVILTLGYIPGYFEAALRIGLYLLVMGFLAMAAMLAFQALAFCVRFCRSRGQGEVNNEMQQL